MKYRAPRLSVNEDNLTVSKLNFTSGDYVKSGEIIAELETTKASFEILAETSDVIQYFVAEGSIIAVEDLIASQGENKTVETKSSSEGTVFTKAAQSLIRKYKIDLKRFEDMNIVRSEDVSKLLRERTKKPSNIETEAIKLEQDKIKYPSLNSYSFVPSASIRFTFDMITQDKEAEFWKRLYQIDLIDLCNVTEIFNFVYFEDTLHLFPINQSSSISKYRNELNNSALEVYRKKSATGSTKVCVSYLKSTSRFEHSALLFKGSKVTIAVSEVEGSDNISFEILYDHRYLDGYTLLKCFENF